MNKETLFKDLQHDTWYWYTHYTEGDSFNSAFILNDVHAFIDGKGVPLENMKEFTFYEAILPNINQE